MLLYFYRTGSSLIARRPTGFVFNNNLQGETNDGMSVEDDTIQRRKSVLFDNNIEKREIESGIDDDDDIDGKDDDVIKKTD